MMFDDLYRHQEWADAVVWRAVLASDAAQSDERIHKLLGHLHMTQRAFTMLWNGEDTSVLRNWQLPSLRDVLQLARENHERMFAFTRGEHDVNAVMEIAWADYYAKRKAAPTTLADTLLQVPMHSTYHRGQVNARLRELGSEPPLRDYIAWVWFGKPAAEWG